MYDRIRPDEARLPVALDPAPQAPAQAPASDERLRRELRTAGGFAQQQQLVRPSGAAAHDESGAAADAVDTLPLGGTSRHEADLETRNGRMVPLRWAEGQAKGGGERPAGPTTVRVILDKVECLSRAVIPDPSKVGMVDLGVPEDLTVVNGDRVEVLTWNENSINAQLGKPDPKVPVRIGFRVERGDAVLTQDGATARTQGHRTGAVTPEQTAAKADPCWLGTLSGDGRYAKGGFHYGMKVSGLRGPQVVRIRAVAWVGGPKQAGALRHATSDDVLEAADAYNRTHTGKDRYEFHQQTQAYGDLAGDAEFAESGQWRVLGMPGWYDYSLKPHAAEKDAAGKPAPGFEPQELRVPYWVPIQFNVTNRSDRPGKVKILYASKQMTGESQAQDVMAIDGGAGFTSPPRRVPQSDIPQSGPQSEIEQFSGALERFRSGYAAHKFQYRWVAVPLGPGQSASVAVRFLGSAVGKTFAVFEHDA